jgi:hypothetical protein
MWSGVWACEAQVVVERFQRIYRFWRLLEAAGRRGQFPLASSAAYRARRWLCGRTFLYLGLATIAAALAATAALDAWAYRWLFGLSVGPGAAGLVTVLLMGNDSIAAQSELAIEVRARLLDPSGDE